MHRMGGLPWNGVYQIPRGRNGLVLSPENTVTYFRFAEIVTRGVWPDLFAGCRFATRGSRCAGRGLRHSPSTTFPRLPPGSLLASRKNLSAIRPRIFGIEHLDRRALLFLEPT